MNYQPFFGMNILLSDQLLLEIQQQKLAISFLFFVSLFSLYFLFYGVHCLIRSYFFRPVSVSNGAIDDSP